MVEPQDPNRYHQMMNKQQEAVIAIAQMNQTLPQEFEEEAQASLNQLCKFRAEIDADLDELEAKAATIKAKFQDKLHQDGLKRGFLMSPIVEYEKHLNFNRTALTSLLQEDQDMWTCNLREAQERAKLAQNRIQGFLEKQQQDLLAFLKQNELTTIVAREQFQLRKLPLWGVTDVRDSDINFEWPKLQDLERSGLKKMPPLTSITFWFKDVNTVCLRGIKFEHSCNFKSPLFETNDTMLCKIVVEKESIKTTTKVSACCRETQRDSIKSISFSNDQGPVAEVNHYKREIGVPMPKYSLNPGEELIGGYGVSNRQRFITSFGFIALKRGPR